jgi:hypothetical protein
MKHICDVAYYATEKTVLPKRKVILLGLLLTGICIEMQKL